MKLVVQRVEKALVKVVNTKKVVGKIGKGLFILVGIGKEDDFVEAKKMAEIISKLRIFSDKNGKMNLSVKDTDSEILVVSQFTLYAETSGGNRPSFIKAALPEQAEKIYNDFINNLKSLGLRVKKGSFGDYMQISAEMDGPVTIIY